MRFFFSRPSRERERERSIERPPAARSVSRTLWEKGDARDSRQKGFALTPAEVRPPHSARRSVHFCCRTASKETAAFPQLLLLPTNSHAHSITRDTDGSAGPEWREGGRGRPAIAPH